MKLTAGILTFHAQLNYGGVLQCWALQTALAGFETVARVQVIDRWLHPTNATLLGHVPHYFQNRAEFRLLIRTLLGLGEGAVRRRHLRTQRFLRDRVWRTPYHFYAWQDFSSACASAGAQPPDVVVVGSDQVWSTAFWANPRPYLLEGAPTDLRAISYAASFGCAALPAEQQELFRRALTRFSAVSCRETEGVSICQNLGVTATHVVDPTLLVEPSVWRTFAGCAPARASAGCPRRIAAYFIAEDLDTLYPVLDAFARQHHCRIDLFGDVPPDSWWLAMPTRPAAFVRWVRTLARRWFGRVKLRVSAGPREFVRTMARADAVVTDSFHAVMFASIFEKNVRVLRPKSPSRQAMFARITEFAAHVEGTMIADDLPAALRSLVRDPSTRFDAAWIAARRADSRNWLEKALECVARAKGIPGSAPLSPDANADQTALAAEDSGSTE